MLKLVIGFLENLLDFYIAIRYSSIITFQGLGQYKFYY